MLTNQQIPSGYKTSPLGPIPWDWKVEPLKEIADVDQESLPSSTPFNYEFDYISLSDVDSETLTIKTSRQQFSTSPSRARRIVRKGDVIMSTVRPNLQGFSIIRKDVRDYIASTGFAVISCKNCFNLYLYHYLFSTAIKKQLHQLLVGSNYPAINSSDVINLKIILPRESEQTAIANLLSTWDEAISKTSALVKQHEQRKNRLSYGLLSKKIRLSGCSEKWKTVSLGDIFERVTRKNNEGNRNVVTISAQGGFVRQEDYFNKVVASDILDGYFLIEEGEFCYNKSYSQGYPWGAIKVLREKEKAVVTTLYICFKLRNQSNSSLSFFEHFLGSGILDKGLSKIAREGGRAHGLLNVTPSDFFDLKIEIPNYLEQLAIASVLEGIDKEIAILKTKLTLFKEQKRGLMQQLLTGKKRLKINQ